MIHGTWTDKELEQIKDRSDLWLMTRFMNTYSLTSREITAYPYNYRRVFFVDVPCSDKPIKVYATDKENAARYAVENYKIDYPVALLEETTTYIQIQIEEEGRVIEC